MIKRAARQRAWQSTMACIMVIISPLAKATVVEFQTVVGNFEVNLYDNATPETVANFLNYVNNGRYTGTVMHRSAPGFVVQGGGFTFDQALPFGNVAAFPAVVNEPEFANIRGTIAMAKIGGNPNSATSQWFFNLADNTANLDGQNGGFTVFGEVVGSGMDIVDQIAALPVYDFGGAFTELPLRNYTQADFNNNIELDSSHPVLISAVIVSDSTVDSAAGLNPQPNTITQAPPPATPPPPTPRSGGGGTFGMFGIVCLFVASLRRAKSASGRQGTPSG